MHADNADWNVFIRINLRPRSSGLTVSINAMEIPFHRVDDFPGAAR
jgi:hypothetical protein